MTVHLETFYSSTTNTAPGAMQRDDPTAELKPYTEGSQVCVYLWTVNKSIIAGVCVGMCGYDRGSQDGAGEPGCG